MNRIVGFRALGEREFKNDDGKMQKYDAQKSCCDTYRANDNIFPCSFNRRVLVVKADQKSTGQGSGLYGNPNQAEIIAD